jgi:hypothetical protein
MPWLQYYADENLRQPILKSIRCSREEALGLLRAWTREYLRPLKPLPGSDGRFHAPRIKFVRGNRRSCANSRAIQLNLNWLNLLVVAHEFAHCWHMRLQARGLAKLQTWHNSEHAELTDILCRKMLAAMGGLDSPGRK